MVKNPTVSVIIPTYNRANLIGGAIESVLNQTYQDFEIIVIDDGSTDNTEGIVKSFNNFKIRYISHGDNRGVSAARNTGIKTCQGEYIAFLDSDDEWLPEKLDQQIKVFQNASSEVGAVYSEVIYMDENGKNINKKYYNPQKEGYIYEDLLVRNYVSTSALLIKKECFDRAGLFDVSLNFHEDWDMWIRIAKFYRFIFTKVPLARYRQHTKQITKDLELKNIAEQRIIIKYTPELEKRKKVLSQYYFRLGNRFCHMGKTKEGRRYLCKAISLYPFFVRYYICIVGSLFGPKCFIYFVNKKRCLTNVIITLLIKLKKIIY